MRPRRICLRQICRWWKGRQILHHPAMPLGAANFCRRLVTAAAPTLQHHQSATPKTRTQQPRTICLTVVQLCHICLAPPNLPDFWAEFSWGNAAATNLPQADLTRGGKTGRSAPPHQVMWRGGGRNFPRSGPTILPVRQIRHAGRRAMVFPQERKTAVLHLPQAHLQRQAARAAFPFSQNKPRE